MANTSPSVEEVRVLGTAEGELDVAAAGGLRQCLMQAAEQQGPPGCVNLNWRHPCGFRQS